MPEAFTAAEAADILKTSDDSIYSLIRSGRLHATDISLGRKPCWRISRKAIDDFLNGSVAKTENRRSKRVLPRVPNLV